MKRFVTAMAGSLLLLVTIVMPAVAGGTHGSCAGFGAVTAGLAPGGGLGQLVSTYAPTAPGTISGIIAAEHGMYCVPR
jgi:hypothetical protein